MLDCLLSFIWSANFGLAASKECLTVTAVLSQLSCPSCRDGLEGAARRDDGVQEDSDQTGLGDGRGHDGVSAEG